MKYIIYAFMIFVFGFGMIYTQGVFFSQSDSMSSNYDKLQRFVPVVSWILFFYTILFNKIRFNKYLFHSVIIFLFLNIFLSCFMGSYLIFKQPIEKIGSAMFWYGGILIYYVLMINKNKISYKTLFYILIFSEIFNYFIGALVFYSNSIQSMFIDSFTQTRFEEKRVMMGTASVLSVCYFAARLIIGKYKSILEKIFYITGLVLTVYVNVFISKNRITIIWFIIALLVLYFFKNSKTWSKYIAGLFLLMILLVAVASIFDFQHSTFIRSFLPNENTIENRNILTRINAMQFYWGELKKTFFCGIGWNSISSNVDSSIVYGINELKYFPIDLYIFGTVIMYGWLSIFVLYKYTRISLGCIAKTYLKTIGEDNYIVAAIGLFTLEQVLSGNFYWSNNAFLYGVILFLINRIYDLGWKDKRLIRHPFKVPNRVTNVDGK